MKVPAIRMELHPEFFAQSHKRFAGVERDVLTAFQRVVPPFSGLRRSGRLKLGAEKDRIGSGDHRLDRFDRIREMLKHFKRSNHVKFLARVGFQSFGKKVLAKWVLPPEIESSVSHQTHKKTVAAAIIQKTAIGICAEI